MAQRFSNDDFPMPGTYKGASNGFEVVRSIDGKLASVPQNNTLKIDDPNNTEDSGEEYD